MDDLRSKDDEKFMEDAQEDLGRLEVIRKTKLKAYNFRKSIGLPITALLALPTIYIDYLLLFIWRGSDDDGGFGLTFALLGAAWWWITQPKRQYAKEYKQKILPKIAKLFGDFTYLLDGKIDMAKMRPSKIIPSHSKYKSEDYFMGTFKGVDLEFSEIELSEMRGSGKNRRRVITFKGVAVLLEMNSKKFNGHTILDKDAGKISEWFKERSTKMKRANLVDPEFEKMFDVYTTDQMEARYLIDPIMIESLKGLNEEFQKSKPGRFDETADKLSFFTSVLGLAKVEKVRDYLMQKGGSMRAAFFENKMLILVASRHNHFEPADLHIPASDPDSLLEMKREIGQILSIIDKLRLYDPHEIHESAA